MLKNVGLIFKLSLILVIIGAFNWGIIAALQVDYITKYLPYMVTRIIYGIIGLAGLITLVGCFMGGKQED